MRIGNKGRPETDRGHIHRHALLPRRAIRKAAVESVSPESLPPETLPDTGADSAAETAPSPPRGATATNNASSGAVEPYLQRWLRGAGRGVLTRRQHARHIVRMCAPQLTRQPEASATEAPTTPASCDFWPALIGKLLTAPKQLPSGSAPGKGDIHREALRRLNKHGRRLLLKNLQPQPVACLTPVARSHRGAMV